MVARLVRSGWLVHSEGENSKLGSLLAKEYIFRVLLCQDLLMDKVSEKETIQRAQVNNKTVDHVPGAENALYIYIKPGIRISVLPSDLNTMAKDIQFDYWFDIDHSTAWFKCFDFKVLHRTDPSLGQTASGLLLDSRRQLLITTLGWTSK